MERSLDDVKLPCFRGDMLLLKFLALLGHDRALAVSELPEMFDIFVKPIDGVLPSPPPERVLGYLDYLEAQRYASVTEASGVEVVEITPVGEMVAGGIDLVAELEAQWEKVAALAAQ